MVFLVCLVLRPVSLEPQKAGKAMTKNEVIELLESGIDSAKVAGAAQEFGITFEMTAEAETQLRDAGGTDELIKTFHNLTPKAAPAPSRPAAKPSTARPAGPPVLLVEVTPGGAQVYVDDEPMGTTSQAGRLRLSQLQAGQHNVRVSLAGHRDYEQSVGLVEGQTARVGGTLETALAPQAVNPLAAAQPSAPQTQAAASVEPGTLGALIASQSPPGWRGAYLNGVAADGPAEKAGLRSGHSILSVNGQPVNSPQDLQQMMARFHAGEVIQIGYTDGSRMHTTQAHLVARSSLPPPSQPTTSAAANLLGGVVSPGANPPGALPQTPMPAATFAVAHDHGSAGQDYCVGTLAVAGGTVQYRSTNGVHGFNFTTAEIKEAKKNSVYLAALGGFHIRLKQGQNYNFVVLNSAGQYQPPDELLRVIAMSMGRN